MKTEALNPYIRRCGKEELVPLQVLFPLLLCFDTTGGISRYKMIDDGRAMPIQARCETKMLEDFLSLPMSI